MSNDVESEFHDDEDAAENVLLLSGELTEASEAISEGDFDSALETLQELRDKLSSLISYVQTKVNSNG